MIEHLQSHSATTPFLLDHKKSPLRFPSPAVPPRLPKSAGHPLCTFVIDDETGIADSLMEILNGNGYEAVAFYDGQSAIESARQRCPDLVLADVMMPRLNGVETVIAIRNICRRTRIVLFSGQAGTVDLLESARARGYEFELLAKPIHPDKLLKKLADFKKPS
ncbi:MAG TPA: response regulator [Candidatus Angelobacter sp.]|nr:response regulator [Candidatus Angelobacter sp.]